MASSKEDPKHMALMFFLDHLIQKNGQRTIHDLSCQFGARGFTAEMRDAVGATQEGLSDFLSKYPSLFRIDEDSVSVIGYGDLASGGVKASPLLHNLSRDRDYEQEAVEFFVEKLKKFGPEMQIKSLLGHRSQAAPEIRIASGRHLKDFAEFLFSHNEEFIVENDRVRLKHMPEPTDPSLDVDENGLPLIGARAKQTAVEYLKNLVEIQETPMPMESLYRQFCTRFSHAIRQEVATNPKELLQFLKLNRHIFFIRSNKVSIVRNRNPDGTPIIDAAGNDCETSSNGSATPRENVGEVLNMTVVVKTLKSAQAAMQEVAGMYTEGKHPLLAPELSNVLSVDFKLVTLDQKEFVTLVIVGTVFGKLYVFDVAHSASILVESGLKDLLEADDYVKVMHDCKKVCGLLWHQYQIATNSVFDTQVANTLLQHQRTGRALHEIKPISFLTLQRLYYPQSVMLSDTGPRKVQKRDFRYWSLRPLTDEMIQIAVEEAHLLVPTIFSTMTNAIKPEFRELFGRLCQENIDYFIKHQEVQVQRKERRNRFALTVINEKLQHDPTGASLTNREKKILSQAENDEKTADMYEPPQPHQIYYNPLQNGGVIDVTKPPPPLPVCACQCQRSKITMEAATQTLSTGDIAITQIFKDNPSATGIKNPFERNL